MTTTAPATVPAHDAEEIQDAGHVAVLIVGFGGIQRGCTVAAARGYGDVCGAAYGGGRGGGCTWLRAGPDEFRGPGHRGERGSGSARSLPAGDGDRTRRFGEDPARR